MVSHVEGHRDDELCGRIQGRDGTDDLDQPEVGVVADVDGRSFVAECKGDVINTKHAGQLPRLRKRLCEAVGLSMATELLEGRRQFAVAPETTTTIALAKKITARAKAAGVEIAQVDGLGNVDEILC
jgi:hypothetical protein